MVLVNFKYKLLYRQTRFYSTAMDSDQKKQYMRRIKDHIYMNTSPNLPNMKKDHDKYRILEGANLIQEQKILQKDVLTSRFIKKYQEDKLNNLYSNSFKISNSYDEKLDSIIVPIYEPNSKIEEFKENSNNKAQGYLTNLLEKNQFTDDIERPKDYKNMDDFWQVLNNSGSSTGPNINECYHNVSHEINTTILGVSDLLDVD
jgi:hypothetical protein